MCQTIVVSFTCTIQLWEDKTLKQRTIVEIVVIVIVGNVLKTAIRSASLKKKNATLFRVIIKEKDLKWFLKPGCAKVFIQLDLRGLQRLQHLSETVDLNISP